MTSSIQTPQMSDFDDLKQLLHDTVAEGTVTSITVAVAQNGKTVYEDALGFANVETKARATLDTPFCLASITKVFTATLVAILAEQHKFSLDDPVESHLPANTLQYLHADYAKITIRMLAAHCSGLPGTFVAHEINGPAPAEPRADFLRSYGRVVFPPGEIYEYGNIGFEVLGALVEKLTGGTFKAAMHKYILEPMNMRNSFFSSEDAGIPSVAIGYDEAKKPIVLYNTSTPPSGEMYTSVRDLTRFAMDNLRATTTNLVLSDKVIQDLQKSVVAGARGVDSTFGWYRGDLSTKEPFFFKGGGQPGVTTNLMLLPSHGVSCAVLTNDTDKWDLVKHICKVALSKFVPDITILSEEEAERPTSAFTPDEDLLGEWRGTLQNGGAHQQVRLRITDDGTSTFGLSDKPDEPLSNIKSKSHGFEGKTSGWVECDHQEEFGLRKLTLLLVPWQGRLVGCVTAKGTRPGLVEANIPYSIALERSK